MKALLINPFNREITTVVAPDLNIIGVLDKVYKMLDCHIVELMKVGDATILVDEEGLLAEGQAFWRLNKALLGDTPFYQSHMAGKALVYGTDAKDNFADVFFTAHQMGAIIEFIDPPTQDKMIELCTPTLINMVTGEQL